MVHAKLSVFSGQFSVLCYFVPCLNSRIKAFTKSSSVRSDTWLIPVFWNNATKFCCCLFQWAAYASRVLRSEVSVHTRTPLSASFILISPTSGSSASRRSYIWMIFKSCLREAMTIGVTPLLVRVSVTANCGSCKSLIKKAVQRRFCAFVRYCSA